MRMIPAALALLSAAAGLWGGLTAVVFFLAMGANADAAALVLIR
jgi:hypothetical protein